MKRLDWFNEQHLRKDAEKDINKLTQKVKPLILQKLAETTTTTTTDIPITDEYISAAINTVKV